MPRVTDLAVIESRDAHEDAVTDWNVVRASGIEPARHLERPSSSRPARGATNIGTITCVITGDNDPRNDSANGNLGAELARIRYRFFLGHEPPCAIGLAMVGIKINFSQCRRHSTDVFGQAARNDDLAIRPGFSGLEIVDVTGRPGIGGEFRPGKEICLRLVRLWPRPADRNDRRP